jgi:hypothetical protein
LRRLLRLEGELVQRLASPEADPRLRRVVTRRLLEAIGDVRMAWTADMRATADGGGVEELRRHVSRTLATLEALTASLEARATDVTTSDREFRQVAVPLLFFMRGVEDAGDQALLAWLAPEPLRRTA